MQLDLWRDIMGQKNHFRRKTNPDPQVDSASHSICTISPRKKETPTSQARTPIGQKYPRYRGESWICGDELATVMDRLVSPRRNRIGDGEYRPGL